MNYILTSWADQHKVDTIAGQRQPNTGPKNSSAKHKNNNFRFMTYDITANPSLDREQFSPWSWAL